MRRNPDIYRSAFNIGNYTLFSIMCLSMVIPFMNIVSISFSSEVEVIKNGFMLFPRGFTLEAYKQIFSRSVIFSGLLNSVKVVLMGVPLSVFATSVAAYLLTCKELIGVRILGHMMVFSMMFSAGVIPLYILYKRLGIINTHAVLILPYLMFPYYLIFVKNYFHTIPESMKESARIDGANELLILFRIVIPLAKPIIAVLALWYMVDYWNMYFYPLSFITDAEKKTIQPILRDIVMQTGNGEVVKGGGKLFGKNVTMGVMALTAMPILLIYPYLQKYLVKGIILGAVKG
ncbi:MAG: carbohydrate ABC transporter permease [Ruminiclostridium sp.]|nr:carbohydrate ABC transporter permease [Ruminiclostridium sp.]